MNASWFPTYYVLGGGDPSSVRDVCVCTPSGHPDMRPAYEEWEPNHLYGLLHPPLSPPPSTVAADEPNNLGAKLHVWGDYPDAESEEQVAESIHPRLQVIGQKTWGSPLLVPSYTEFLQIGRKIGYAPPRPTVTDINVGPSGVASDSRSPLANPLWEPSFIIDEHMATRWVSGLGAVNQDDEWVQVELLEPRRISRVVLYWEAAYGKAYSIQVSTDGTTWRDAATVQDGDGGEDEILLDMAEPATFVRMRGIQRGTPHAYSLWEMEIYSPTGE